MSWQSTIVAHIDKVYHLAVGCITIGGLAVIAWTAVHFGFGPAIALSTTLVGIAIEAYQRVRHEGQVELLDAVATAAPGFVAWAAIAIATRAGA